MAAALAFFLSPIGGAAQGFAKSPGPSIATESTTAENYAALSVRAFDGSSELKGNFGGADVYINRIYVGKAPFSTENLAPGSYLIGVSSADFYPQEFFISVSAKTSYKLIFNLVPRTGFLVASCSPQDAELLIDGTSYGSGNSPRVIELRVGSHRLVLRRFAYDEKSQNIEIHDHLTTSVKVKLELAPFTVSRLQVGRPAFDPRNAGSLGRTGLSFTVSSYGSGELEVLNEADEKVASFPFPSFTTWNQDVTWTGRDRRGQPLPDGSYRLRLTARPKAESGDAEGAVGGEAVVREGYVNIDSSLAVRPFGVGGAMTGLLLCPSAAAIPPGIFALELGGSFPVSLVSGSSATGAGIEFAAAYSFGKFGIGFSLGESDIAASILSAALSMRLNLLSAEPFELGIFARGGYSTCLASGSGSASGSSSFEAGLPLGLELGDFSLGLSPGARLVLSLPASGSGSTSGSGPLLRAGVWTASRVYQAGLSACLRGASFASPFSLSWPIEAALEFRAILDPAPFSLSAKATTAISSTGGVDLGFGRGRGRLL
jgi:hypothetical protein